MVAGTFPLDANWRTALHDLGTTPSDVLRRAQLPEDLLSRPDPRLSTDAYFAFWDALEAEVEVPYFPIALAEVVRAESFSPPIFAALCSENLLVAMRRLSKYKRLVAPMALDVVEADDRVSLSLRFLDTDREPPTSFIAAELLFFVQLARLSTREHIVPQRVVMPEPPRPAATYRRFLGVDVTQGPTIAIDFRHHDATRPFFSANEAMWNIFEIGLRQRLAELSDSSTTAERVHAALLELLPSGEAAAEAVANRLAVSKRTLQRRLKDEGTSYADVLANTRERLARHYLTRTTISSNEISFLLGYDETTSFFRAFHDWTGQTPEAVRHGGETGPRRP